MYSSEACHLYISWIVEVIRYQVVDPSIDRKKNKNWSASTGLRKICLSLKKKKPFKPYKFTLSPSYKWILHPDITMLRLKKKINYWRWMIDDGHCICLSMEHPIYCVNITSKILTQRIEKTSGVTNKKIPQRPPIGGINQLGVYKK